MSYCRFGWEGSDVYIYMSSGGWIECSACLLQPTKESTILGHTVQMNESFQAYDTQEMIYHVRQHREAGHCVPTYVEEDLKKDDKENMKYIEECQNANL